MLTDGVGAVLMAAAFQGKPSSQHLPQMRKFSLADKIIYSASLLLAPYYLFIHARKVARSTNTNIPALNPVNHKYSSAVAPAYKIRVIKEVCAKLNCTVNDFLVAIFSISLSKVIKEMKKEPVTQ
jgi:hypothetical protein